MIARRIVSIALVTTLAGLASFVATTSVMANNLRPPGPDSPAVPFGTSFTYQGQLAFGGNAVTRVCDFQFGLWNAASGGGQIGTTLDRPNVQVTRGLFTVQLDFGASAFDGAARWLSVAVRCPAGDGAFVTLSPRIELTPTPYALYSAQTPWSGVTGVPATVSSFASLACQPGEVVKWVGPAWGCAVDANTTYTAGPGLTLDGTQFKVKGSGYANVVIVAQSGGDFASIQAALDNITGASDANRVLVWVAPGVYTETVRMKPYVDIEGAGEQLTRITNAVGECDTGVVVGANHAELRHVTVANVHPEDMFDYCAIAIYNASASPRLSSVTAMGTGVMGGAVAYGVYNDSSSPVLSHVTVTGLRGYAAYGIYNNHSSPTLEDVMIQLDVPGVIDPVYGVYSDHGSLQMTRSQVDGGSMYYTYGVYGISTTMVLHDVAVDISGGRIAEAVTASGSGVQIELDRVTALASGGGWYNYGVHTTGTGAVLRHVRAEGGGYNSAYGVSAGGPTEMNDVVASASGGQFNCVGIDSTSALTLTNVTARSMLGYGYIYTANRWGIRLSGKTARLQDVVIEVAPESDESGGLYVDSSSATLWNTVIGPAPETTPLQGIYTVAASGAYTVSVNSSQVAGTTNTIYNGAGFTTRVGGSKLAGGAVNVAGGAVVCAGVYDENYAFYASTCP